MEQQQTSDGSVTGLGGWVRFLAGFALLYGLLAGLAELDPTARYGLLVALAVVGAAVLVERVMAGAGRGAVLTRLGLGRPTVRALLLAGAIAALVQLAYPLAEELTGAEIGLRPNWVWLLVGTFALHGVAEELVWRGYAFRRLRVGRSFGRAVAWTMPLVAAAHLPIIATSGPAVGAAALLVAAVTSVPLAYLYETGRNSIWAPAVVHTAIDSFKIVVVPADAVMTFSLLLAAVSVTVPMLALIVPRHRLAPRLSGTRGDPPPRGPQQQDHPAPSARPPSTRSRR